MLAPAIRNDLLDWMRDHYDGDLDQLVIKTAKHVRRHHLASGPLWDDIAPFVLRTLYRQHELKPANSSRTHWAASGQEDFTDRVIVQATQEVGVFARWVNVGEGRQVQLGDLTSTECGLLAEMYDRNAVSNGVRRDLYAALAVELRPSQQLRDRFSEESLQTFAQEVMERPGPYKL
jgi:hypothetical protein